MTAAPDAWAGRPPPLWVWLAAGMAVDAACLRGLFGLGALLPVDGDTFILSLLLLALDVLLTAWVSHVVVVPGILRAHGPRTGQDVLKAVLGLPVFLGCTAAFGCVVGIFSGMAAFAVLDPLAMPLLPRLGVRELVFLAGPACGGTAAGSMAHSLRPVFAAPVRAPWRYRSDVAGAGLAAVLFPVAFFTIPFEANKQFGETAVFTLLGTLALLPHLLLLGLDLRRASRA